MARKQRTYTDVEKAEALSTLDLYRGNVVLAARAAGVPRTTLAEWAHNRHISKDVPGIRQVKKGVLSERFNDLAELLLDHVHEKLEDATLQQIVTAAGIAVDKSQLLSGNPTSISETTHIDNRERAKRVNELLDAARERRVGLTLVSDGDADQSGVA